MAGSDEELSDDEIFHGKMTLKEVKKHIWLKHGHNRTVNTTPQKSNHVDLDHSSIQIIETQSQPNLRSIPVDTPSPPSSARNCRNSDESFIKMENLVSKLCLTPEKAAGVELNNTLDIIDFILNNGPNKDSKQPDFNLKIGKEEKIETTEMTEKFIKMEENNSEKEPSKTSPQNKLISAKISTPTQVTPQKKFTPQSKVKRAIKASPKYYTPLKSPRKQEEVFSTPCSKVLETKTPVFKTPANPLKKPSASSLKSTPSKSPMYKHIKSPIATYIKGSIEVPMITNVCPKKPLPGGSMIPKFVKRISQDKQSKENINLPTSAYKSAKKTKVVQEPKEEKPNVAKKLLSTLPKPPVILKHESRQFNSDRKPLIHLQEDSIADLSSLQADLSVCTLVKTIKK